MSGRKNGMSAKLLEVSKLGAGTVLGLQKYVWSMVRLMTEASNK